MLTVDGAGSAGRFPSCPSEPDWFGKIVEFLTLGRGVSEVALDAYQMKVDGLTY